MKHKIPNTDEISGWNTVLYTVSIHGKLVRLIAASVSYTCLSLLVRGTFSPVETTWPILR
jgi:hypothetical protein